MILFTQDWQRYPGAIPHLTTKNSTFIKTAAVIKAMGVKNHMFLLALHNPILQEIDPHSLELTTEEKLLIAAECKINYWYAIREVMKVPSSGGEAVSYIANRANIALSWLYHLHITVILIQIRQTGKTVSTNVLASYLVAIRTYNSGFGLLTKDDKLRGKTLIAVKDTIDALPPYLNQRKRADVANMEELRISSLKNYYIGFVPQASESDALNTGRGFTIASWHFDEVNFQKHIKIAMGAALASGTNARNRAMTNGDPYGTIITTTAGKINEPSGAYIYGMTQRSATWTETYYDTENREDLVSKVRKNGYGKLRVYCEFNHSQLGYTDEWLKDAIEQSEQTGEDVERDFYNRWTSGNRSHPLDTEVLGRIQKSQQDPLYLENAGRRNENYLLRWYIPYSQIQSMLNIHPHLLILDGSEAGGGDDIGIIILNLRTGKPSAVGNLNELNLTQFSDWFCEFFVKYPRLVCLPERRNSGVYIIDHLIRLLLSKDIDPFKRIFNRAVNEPEAHRELHEEIKKPLRQRDVGIYIKHKTVFGFATSGSGLTSRNKLYGNVLHHMTKRIGHQLMDARLISQIMTLVERNGRIDHEIGAHDDLVICMLLGFWFITHAQNITHYGLNPLEMLLDLQDNENGETTSRSPEAIREVKVRHYDRQRSIDARNHLERLVDQYNQEKNPFLKDRLKRQLTIRAGEINQIGDNTVNIDALLSSRKKPPGFLKR